MEAALEVAREAGEDEAFIIGGAQIYRLAMETGVVDTMYLTHVERGTRAIPSSPSLPRRTGRRAVHMADERNEAPPPCSAMTVCLWRSAHRACLFIRPHCSQGLPGLDFALAREQLPTSADVFGLYD